MAMWASGKKALAVCDRCGLQVMLNSLAPQPVAGKITPIKVCSDCLDSDNPQLQLGKVRIQERIALKDPRPDPDLAVSQGLFGFNPVGNPATLITTYPST